MDRSELHKYVKEKMLFEGPTSTGKTLDALKIAKIYLISGKKVVFIDPQYGCGRELDGGLFDDLTNEELGRFTRIDATNIETYLKWMLGWSEEKHIGTQVVQETGGLDCDLKICDGITDEIELYKTTLTNNFIKQGYYSIGETRFIISNKDTFVLPFQFYAKLYDQIKQALVTMLDHKYDMICTMHPLKDTKGQKELEQQLYQKFDSVIRLNKVILPSGFPKWDALTVKNRGKERPDKSNYIENIDVLFMYFIKKFKMEVNDDLLKKIRIEVKKDDQPK